ncbi:hypothetical protein Q644_16115 [Brucella intermedia 229E]|uniref:Uncharacterized protein n=1 Tax=Brucella intermedia 229E TaxID=1337887 RepID=U4VI97_9HYPH|nr:hypothetical protein Q644_16115 [Brucella intermedia 229E]
MTAIAAPSVEIWSILIVIGLSLPWRNISRLQPIRSRMRFICSRSTI